MIIFTLSTPDRPAKTVPPQNHPLLQKTYAKEYDGYSVFFMANSGPKYLGYFSGGVLVKPERKASGAYPTHDPRIRID